MVKKIREDKRNTDNKERIRRVKEDIGGKNSVNWKKRKGEDAINEDSFKEESRRT